MKKLIKGHIIAAFLFVSILSTAGAMDRDGQEAPAAPHQAITSQHIQQEVSLVKMEPKLVYDILGQSMPSSWCRGARTRCFTKYRLVCKKWADIINNFVKLKYAIPLRGTPFEFEAHKVADWKKDLPPSSNRIPAALEIMNYEDSKMGTLYSSIKMLKGHPVDIVQWEAGVNFQRPIPGKRREYEPYIISADNLNCAFDVLADSLNPDILETLDFSKISFSGSSKEFIELLAKFPSLKHLRIKHAQITPEDMEKIINTLPKSLVSLDLIGNSCSGKGFEALIEKLPQLENLKLLGIQTGAHCMDYNYPLSNFYGWEWASTGERTTNDLMKTYTKGKAHHRQIINKSNAISKPLMDSFKATVDPLKRLDYIVLN